MNPLTLYKALRLAEMNGDVYGVTRCLFKMLREGITRKKLIELAMIHAMLKDMERK